MSLIIDRNDYMTKEEYQCLLDKQVDIFSKVESINNDISQDDWYTSYSRRVMYMFDKYDDFCSLGLMLDDLYYKIDVNVDVLNEIKLNVNKINVDNIRKIGGDLWILFKSLKDYEKLKYDIEYYKNKIIDVENFNEKEYFKDVYELINNMN